MKITVEELLQAAERNKVRNTGGTFIEYGDGNIPIKACVIGAMALEVNGGDWETISYNLRKIHPDAGEIGIDHFTKLNTLSTFINIANMSGKRGRKKVISLVRKYFSKSLNTEVEI